MQAHLPKLSVAIVVAGESFGSSFLSLSLPLVSLSELSLSKILKLSKEHLVSSTQEHLSNRLTKQTYSSLSNLSSLSVFMNLFSNNVCERTVVLTSLLALLMIFLLALIEECSYSFAKTTR